MAWNPSDKSTRIVLSNNNLTAASNNASWGMVRHGKGKTKGKWYWEIRMDDIVINATGKRCLLGVCTKAADINNYVGVAANGRGYHNLNGFKYVAGTGVAYGATHITGDIIGVMLDIDVGKIEFLKNGISQGVAYDDLLTLGEVYAAVSLVVSGARVTANFGENPFQYEVPDGYRAYNADRPYILTPNTVEVPKLTDAHVNVDVQIHTNPEISQDIIPMTTIDETSEWSVERALIDRNKYIDITGADVVNVTSGSVATSNLIKSKVDELYSIIDGELVNLTSKHITETTENVFENHGFINENTIAQTVQAVVIGAEFVTEVGDGRTYEVDIPIDKYGEIIGLVVR